MGDAGDTVALTADRIGEGPADAIPARRPVPPSKPKDGAWLKIAPTASTSVNNRPEVAVRALSVDLELPPQACGIAG
jgi:hypothetical protein